MSKILRVELSEYWGGGRSTEELERAILLFHGVDAVSVSAVEPPGLPIIPIERPDWVFSKRSMDNLGTVHPQLQALAKEALRRSPLDFGVIEGIRSKSRQRDLYDRGASKTMNSKHLTGDAFDFMVYLGSAGTWETAYYDQLGAHFKDVAESMDIAIKWGGDFRNFYDGGHIERKI